MSQTGSIFVLLLVLGVAVNLTLSAMTMEQLKQTTKMMRNLCQPKTGVSTEVTPDRRSLAQAMCALKLNVTSNACTVQISTRVITQQVIDQASQGVFAEDDRNLRCYCKCAMQMAQSMANGKLRPDSAISQAKKLLPLEIRDRTIAAIEKCRNVDKENPDLDACDLAFVATKCFYNADPETFLFP